MFSIHMTGKRRSIRRIFIYATNFLRLKEKYLYVSIQIAIDNFGNHLGETHIHNFQSIHMANWGPIVWNDNQDSNSKCQKTLLQLVRSLQNHLSPEYNSYIPFSGFLMARPMQVVASSVPTNFHMGYSKIQIDVKW